VRFGVGEAYLEVDRSAVLDIDEAIYGGTTNDDSMGIPVSVVLEDGVGLRALGSTKAFAAVIEPGVEPFLFATRPRRVEAPSHGGSRERQHRYLASYGLLPSP